jgi:hypothetical protein
MQYAQLNILLLIIESFVLNFCFNTSQLTNLTSRDRITAMAILRDVTCWPPGGATVLALDRKTDFLCWADRLLTGPVDRGSLAYTMIDQRHNHNIVGIFHHKYYAQIMRSTFTSCDETVIRSFVASSHVEFITTLVWARGRESRYFCEADEIQYSLYRRRIEW